MQIRLPSGQRHSWLILLSKSSLKTYVLNFKNFKDVSEKFVVDSSTGFNWNLQRLQWIPLKSQSHVGEKIQMFSMSAPISSSERDDSYLNHIL